MKEPCPHCGCLLLHHRCWKMAAKFQEVGTDDLSAQTRKDTDNLSEKGGKMAKKRRKTGC